MSEAQAPERIWIMADLGSDDMDAGTWCSADDGGLEYVRADRVEVLEEQLQAANTIIASERGEVLSLRAENKALRDVATDAIETMEAGPFFPADEGKRLRAALAKIGGRNDA